MRYRYSKPIAVACESFANRSQTSDHAQVYRGTVMYRGEYWSAHCATPVFAEQRVVIANRKGLLLEVVAHKPMRTGVYR